LARLDRITFPQGHWFHGESINAKLSIIEDYVGWCVADRIRVDAPLVGYDALETALKALTDRTWPFHFATTNYDCNIERLLVSAGIPFHDGFVGKQVTDIVGRPWRLGTHFNFSENETCLVAKLHGSINWFVCHDVNGTGASTMAVAPLNCKPAEGYMTYIDQPGHRFTPKHSPEMLRGSLSKVDEYSYGVYSHLLAGFEEMLRCADIVVVAGFGWRDEGVAARLLRYGHTSDKALLVLDGTQSDPAVTTCAWFRRGMIGDVNGGRPISIYRSHMSELNHNELAKIIDQCLRALRRAP
jgi:hypothetical protein